jgi:hypothetical protein
MNNIGSKISTAASAINPFKGTVNTEETSNKKLTFHGTEFKLDLGSTGNFALRKIYNSIVNAPGHAFNAVGLKSFTNYLYGKTDHGKTDHHDNWNYNGDAEKAPLDETPSLLTKENLETHIQDSSTDSLSKSSPLTINPETHNRTHGDDTEKYTGSLLKATRENQVIIDPNLNKAATKIQASYRGYAGREEAKEQKANVEKWRDRASDHGSNDS